MWQVAQPVTNQLKGLQSQRWSMFLQKFESVEAESEKNGSWGGNRFLASCCKFSSSTKFGKNLTFVNFWWDLTRANSKFGDVDQLVRFFCCKCDFFINKNHCLMESANSKIAIIDPCVKFKSISCSE